MVKGAYDFSGPIVGPLAIVVGLPLVCYMLVYGSNELVEPPWELPTVVRAAQCLAPWERQD